MPLLTRSNNFIHIDRDNFAQSHKEQKYNLYHMIKNCSASVKTSGSEISQPYKEQKYNYIKRDKCALHHMEKKYNLYAI